MTRAVILRDIGKAVYNITHSLTRSTVRDTKQALIRSFVHSKSLYRSALRGRSGKSHLFNLPTQTNLHGSNEDGLLKSNGKLTEAVREKCGPLIQHIDYQGETAG